MSEDPVYITDDVLFEEIGRQSLVSEEHDLGESPEQESVLGLQSVGSLLEIGQRIYIRVNCEMYNLFCGSDKADRADRDKLLNASGISSTLMKALLTGLIVKYLGLATALAAAVSSLMLRRIVLPAGNEVCKYWGEHLTL